MNTKWIYNNEWIYKDTVGFIMSLIMLNYLIGSLITFIVFLFLSHALNKNGESNV